jgi:hypothetical protein
MIRTLALLGRRCLEVQSQARAFQPTVGNGCCRHILPILIQIKKACGSDLSTGDPYRFEAVERLKLDILAELMALELAACMNEQLFVPCDDCRLCIDILMELSFASAPDLRQDASAIRDALCRDDDATDACPVDSKSSSVQQDAIHGVAHET